MNKKAKEVLHDGVRGCLAGVALGDAFGMPWEMYKAEEIADSSTGKGVVGLQGLPAARRKLKDTRGLSLGETTDDWQLTRAVAASFIRSRCFNLVDQAAAHVEAFETSTKGWGKTTSASLAELKLWFDTRGREGRRPGVAAPLKEKQGSGNGVIMKIAPLACAIELHHQVNRYDPDDDPKPCLRDWVIDLSYMTHSDPNAANAAVLVAEMMRESLNWANFGSCSETREHFLSALHTSHLPRAKNLPPVKRVFGDPTQRDYILASVETLRKEAGTSCLAVETAAFTLGTFLRHPTDFRAAVLEAINAGGDTDTNASIVGALVGANVGLRGIPAEWIKAVPDAHEAIQVADDLFKLFFPE